VRVRVGEERAIATASRSEAHSPFLEPTVRRELRSRTRRDWMSERPATSGDSTAMRRRLSLRNPHQLGILLLTIVASAAAPLVAGAGEKPPAPAPFEPGDHVWTSNPSSAAGGAFLTGLSFPPLLPIPEPVRPYRPGDTVWLTTPPTGGAASDPEGSFETLATGCQRVPSSGYIGQGVFANTTFQYSNYWSWSDASSYQSFTWYIKKTDQTTQAYASSYGGGGSWSGPANIYQWKVQNHGSAPQAWNVCYDVR
jgi:hypothetical protein